MAGGRRARGDESKTNLNLLNVEADGGNCGDNFSKLQLVQDGSFTGGVEANHENTNLLLAEDARD